MPLALLFAVAMQGSNIPPTVKFDLPTKPVAVNSTVKGTVSLTFAEGLHGYQNPPSSEFLIPVSVKLKTGKVKLLPIKYPAGTDLTIAGETKPVKVYSGHVVIPVSFKVSKIGGAVVLSIDYQQCTEAACFPPSTLEAKAVLHIKS